MDTLHLKNHEEIYAACREGKELYVIPPLFQPEKFEGGEFLWIINEGENSFSYIKTEGKYTVSAENGERLIAFSQGFIRNDFEGYPSCDFLGNAFSFSIGGSGELTQTLARFYWKNLLCECAERSFMAEKKRLREGVRPLHPEHLLLRGHLPGS